MSDCKYRTRWAWALIDGMGWLMEFIEAIKVKEVEIAHLDLRYGHTRVRRGDMVSLLVNSIERCGQLTPVITVEQGPFSFVLIDGYLRVAALKRCGRDTVVAEIWHCAESFALIRVLMRGNERKWEALEQAWLIRELQDRHKLSQAEIAHHLGRDKSWVSRRLCLLCILPEEIVEAVRCGCLSTWAATRVLAPLARANQDHAKALTDSLVKEKISTRDLMEFFRHYQKANRKNRDKMVLEPVLFLKALQAREEDKQAEGLRDGPEGKWLKDLRVTAHIFRRLRKDVSTVIYPGQGNLDRSMLLKAFDKTKQLVLALEQDIRRVHLDDFSGKQTSNPELASQGDQDSTNQPDAEGLQEHCASGAAGTDQGCLCTNFPSSTDHTTYPATVPNL